MASPSGGRLDRATVVRVVVVVLALALVAVIAYRQIRRASADQRTVWVAAGALAAGDAVDEAALTDRRVREEALPPDVLLDRASIEGRTLTRSKPAGSPFFEADFRSPPPAVPGLAESIPAGRVMITVEPSNFRPINEIAQVLRQGDRFDILAVRPGGAERSAPPTAVARDVIFIAWMDPRPPAGAASGDEEDDDEPEGLFASLQNLVPEEVTGGGGPTGPAPLLVGVWPEQVAALTQAQADGVFLFFVLHGRTEVKEGRLLPVGRSVFRPVELIAGSRRQVRQVER